MFNNSSLIQPRSPSFQRGNKKALNYYLLIYLNLDGKPIQVTVLQLKTGCMEHLNP